MASANALSMTRALTNARVFFRANARATSTSDGERRGKMKTKGKRRNDKRAFRAVTTVMMNDEGGKTSKKVVVLGGTGRVGGSTAAALLLTTKNMHVVLAGRRKDGAMETKARYPSLIDSSFVEVDVNDKESVKRAITGADLVINTAGPFQRRATCAALEAAIESKVNYLDVCDDAGYGEKAKELSARAKAAGVSAITCGGIYPGVSNLMVRDTIESMFEEFRAQEANAGKEPEVEYVLYNYFTAGSGGVGTTILATSFLLCGEDVVIWEDGKRVIAKPASQRKVVDFGKGVGRREVFLYNLPEVASTRKVFNAGTVKARFGTSPGIWNGAMVAIANAVPKDMLENPESMKALASISEPFVRAVDKIVGEKTSIRIEVKLKNWKQSVGLYTHPRLSECVGTCTAAFAQALLNGECASGVWYPEEKEAVANRRALLERASKGSTMFVLNQAGWLLETQPLNLGFGISIDL